MTRERLTQNFPPGQGPEVGYDFDVEGNAGIEQREDLLLDRGDDVGRRSVRDFGAHDDPVRSLLDELELKDPGSDLDQ